MTSPYRERAPVEPEDHGDAAAFWARVEKVAAEESRRAASRAATLRVEVVLLDETLGRRRARLEALRRLSARGDTVDAATLAREVPEVYPPIRMAPMRVIQL